MTKKNISAKRYTNRGVLSCRQLSQVAEVGWTNGHSRLALTLHQKGQSERYSVQRQLQEWQNVSTGARIVDVKFAILKRCTMMGNALIVTLRALTAQTGSVEK